MLTDKTFIEMYAKAIGKAAAREMLSEVRKTLSTKEKPTESYLNEFGNEVHVNCDVAASLTKGETLQERIARFDKLAERVAAIRYARAMGMLPDVDDGPDEDPNDFDKLDDVEEIDAFGDLVEKPSVTEPAPAGNVTANGGSATDGAGSVAGDESATAAATAATMASEPEASVSE